MPDQKNTYYSHGKLLLSGEYFVLKGAKSIALPLRFGQKMEVSQTGAINQISWKAYANKDLWFSCKFQLHGFEIIQTSDERKAQTLIQIFKNIHELDPSFLINQSLDFRTHLNFNRQWGLGSSSTLIANLAQWAKVDPYLLNELSFKGSGFDIACASANGPIFFQKGKKSQDVRLNYPFQEQLYFVYSGAKKNTRNEVLRFLNEKSVSKEDIARIGSLSEKIASANVLTEFQALMQEHEQLVSALIGVEPVKNQFFKDFVGEIKSLGAWGGDFFLVATKLDKQEVMGYFNKKGLRVIFPWSEIVLKKN